MQEPPPPLPWDILHTLMSRYLGGRDALPLAMTCKRLYALTEGNWCLRRFMVCNVSFEEAKRCVRTQNAGVSGRYDETYRRGRFCRTCPYDHEAKSVHTPCPLTTAYCQTCHRAGPKRVVHNLYAFDVPCTIPGCVARVVSKCNSNTEGCARCGHRCKRHAARKCQHCKSLIYYGDSHYLVCDGRPPTPPK